MNLTRTRAALSLTALAVAVTAALSLRAEPQAQPQTPTPQGQPQTPTPPSSQVPQPAIRPQPGASSTPVRAVIFLDPAHGGAEIGAAIGNNVSEKDVTLAFAQRLHAALASAGFNVITTRDSDLTSPLPTDQRAEAANRLHALACVVIHATAAGSGVHLYTSTLPPAPSSDESSAAASPPDATTPFMPIPWESAQASFVDRSRRLSDLLKAKLATSSLPVLTGTAPVRPLDNLMCPAVAIEIAPNSASISPADTGYQQQVVFAVASALQLWRDQNTHVTSLPAAGAQ